MSWWEVGFTKVYCDAGAVEVGRMGNVGVYCSMSLKVRIESSFESVRKFEILIRRF